MRSVEKYAGAFTTRIQILVNDFAQRAYNASRIHTMGKQRPRWLENDTTMVQVPSQEEFFGHDERKCLPSFDSLTIESQPFYGSHNVRTALSFEQSEFL
jgi:hypothetical protein